MAQWHDKTSARAEWGDAKNIADGALDDLLEAAQEACWWFTNPPAVGDASIPDEVPVRFRVAQLLHARSVWQLPRGGSEGQVGIDGYSTRLYVLGYDVQKVLRPPVYGERVG